MDYSLGCLEVSAFRIGKGADVNVFPGGSSVQINTWRAGSDIDLDILNEWTPVDIQTFVVCSINTDAYLRTSADVVWLTPDMIAEQFDIYSNVVWNIN